MASPLEIAKAKLAEFKPFFSNPKYGHFGTKEVLLWTYHNPNGTNEKLWVPLKTKENQPLTNSKMKNNIHCRCVGKLPAASRPPRPQISIHAPLPASDAPSAPDRPSKGITKEEVIERFAPDGTIISRLTRRW